MKIVAHRGLWSSTKDCNTVYSFMSAFNNGFGIELDVRDYGSKLVVSHDLPSEFSTELEEIFLLYNENIFNEFLLAINIKSDGLVVELGKLISTYNIVNYFTFDMSTAELMKYKQAGTKYFCRISEYENTPLLINESCGIWLDAFDSDWYSKSIIDNILKYKKQICFVSAELHGRDYIKQWELIKRVPENDSFILCTDHSLKAREFFK